MISLSPSARQGLENFKKGLRGPTVFIRPTYTVKKNDLHISLWVAQRKLPHLLAGAPFLTRHQAILVPVAPDLKMVFGVAKMVRDQGADRIQLEADKIAPLPPGEAFIGSGARYRYEYTVLAVIFDEVKRTNPDLITRAVRRGAELANQRHCTSLIVPDMTENLLSQPNWITQQQRRETADIAALTLIGAIRASQRVVDRFNIWCWDPQNVGSYLRELKRL